jgi:hypothetical protein
LTDAVVIYDAADQWVQVRGALSGDKARRAIPAAIITANEVTAAEREWLDGLVDRIRDKGVLEQLVLVADVHGRPAALIGGWRISA